MTQACTSQAVHAGQPGRSGGGRRALADLEQVGVGVAEVGTDLAAVVDRLGEERSRYLMEALRKP
jgi:hypothetical protein